jgi:hypothetical protein
MLDFPEEAANRSNLSMHGAIAFADLVREC